MNGKLYKIGVILSKLNNNLHLKILVSLSIVYYIYIMSI